MSHTLPNLNNHFPLLTPRQIFAIPVNDAKPPPSPEYLDCGNLQQIRNMAPSTLDSTTDFDMLISFFQSGAIQDQNYTWGDTTELLRWLFSELTKRLNHFLDLKVAELPKGEKPPMLLRQMKGVSKDMKALVRWSRRRTGRQELVDLRAFDQDLKRWKLIDLSRELGVHNLVVLISEAKYRAEFPDLGWISVSNSNSAALSRRRRLARKKGAENNASVEESQDESEQVAYLPMDSSLKQPEASLTKLPKSHMRKRRIQVFRDSPKEAQPALLGIGAETEASLVQNHSRVPDPVMDDVNDFDLYSDTDEFIDQRISPRTGKVSTSGKNVRSQPRKAHSSSETETSLPSVTRLPVVQPLVQAHRNKIPENNYGFFGSFDSQES